MKKQHHKITPPSHPGLTRVQSPGFTVVELLFYIAGLSCVLYAACVVTRLAAQVTQQLPSHTALVATHLPAVRQLCADRGKVEVRYELRGEQLYRIPVTGRQVCIARGVASVTWLRPGHLRYETADGWCIEEKVRRAHAAH